MNPIELEWLHLKRDHLSGQMFDSEDNLMWGIEDALLSRYDSLGFDTSYFEFSYAQLLTKKSSSLSELLFYMEMRLTHRLINDQNENVVRTTPTVAVPLTLSLP